MYTDDKEVNTFQVLKSPEVQFKVENPKHYYPAWKEIMSHPVILKIISESFQINFKDHIPSKGSFDHKHSQRYSDIISEEIQKLLQKKVITKFDINEENYFSFLFVRPKKDGSFRAITYLKYLNEENFTYHFKMEKIKQIIYMITLK